MKIAIIGTGNVGASIAALLIARNNISKISLVDINKNLALGKALDLNHLSAVFRADTKLKASDDYKIIKDADICVITAGFTRKENQDREELLKQNASIVKIAAQKIAKFAPNSVIIVVTNPLDPMTFIAQKASGFSKQKVFGMAGELDSARLRFEIAAYFHLKNSQVKGSVLGEHGKNMILWDTQACGEKADFDPEQILEDCVKKSGEQIISLLGTSAYYAPAAGVVKMCEAIKEKDGKTLICSALDEDNIPCGVPVKFGKKIKIKKTDADLSHAKRAIKAQCDRLEIILKEEK